MTRLIPPLMSILLTSACAQVNSDKWELVFSDSGSGDWADQWFLEGANGRVENGPGGMEFSAGPEWGDDASHAVLWTKQSFEGDLRIEFDYTRLDSLTKNAVNILYIQATGLGTEDSPTDIRQSTAQRVVPRMASYFLNMNAFQISYAVSGEGRVPYVAARRYPAESEEAFETGTRIQPVYQNEELFRTGETYHITAVKEGDQLTFSAERDGRMSTFEWDTSVFPPIIEGRIGLRLMYARSSRFKNVEVYVRK